MVVFVVGWILPHFVLGTFLLAVFMLLPRAVPRFAVEAPKQAALAVAFGLPTIVFMLRFALRYELEAIQVGQLQRSPATAYMKWIVVGVLALVGLLGGIVFGKPVFKVGDTSSFAALAAIVVVACMTTLFITL